MTAPASLCFSACRLSPLHPGRRQVQSGSAPRVTFTSGGCKLGGRSVPQHPSLRELCTVRSSEGRLGPWISAARSGDLLKKRTGASFLPSLSGSPPAPPHPHFLGSPPSYTAGTHVRVHTLLLGGTQTNTVEMAVPMGHGNELTATRDQGLSASAAIWHQPISQMRMWRP